MPHLYDSDQPVVAVGVGEDGEAAGGVPPGHAVHGVPGRRVRLVLICHRQVRHDHIHPVLRHFSVELQKPWKHVTSAGGACKGHTRLNIHQSRTAHLSSLEL